MGKPLSTYRLQLHKDFTFKDLEEILDYLHELGVTTLYASPITTAFTGSNHGYDVTDPLVINPEIGTRADLERIAARLKEYGMSWIQDIVPNHMAYDAGNGWLWDVLERGRRSAYYDWFDIDTSEEKPLLGRSIMAPFLGKTLTECLQAGEIQLAFSAERGLVIRYFEHEYPVSVACYAWVITLADGYPIALIDSLADWEQASSSSAEEWKAFKTAWLESLLARAEWKSFIEMRVAFVNERVSLVEELLQHQHYILTAAHLASSVINYRRFFTVNSLICLRMERADVFTAYHAMIHELYTMGLIQGLRIDHIDGLADPDGYVDRLRGLFGDDCYIVVEKILTGAEKMPAGWRVEGESGYAFLAAAGQLLTDADGADDLRAYYRDVISEDMPPYPDVVFRNKLRYLKEKMGGEWNNLALLFGGDLKEALGVLMASFPVYRYYAGAVPQAVFQRARERRPDLEEGFAEIERLLEDPVLFSRLMQFTGPLAAKGIEDTSFYEYNALIAHNEVGDGPVSMGITVDEFHRRMIERQATQPFALNGTTTHDTKRGEDGRVRLHCLSAMPDQWRAAVDRWMAGNRSLAVEVDGQRIPSLNDEYFIYQTLIGSLPEDCVVTDLYRERVHGWLTKALREANVHTGYDQPNEVYESGCHGFLTALLDNKGSFLGEFLPFAQEVISLGMKYSLSLLTLKMTCPGIPDIYQGAESWQLSLVDPDNRSLVDFAGMPDNEKTALTRQLLALRKDHAELFLYGEYVPVEAPANMIAYKRRYKGRELEFTIALPRINYL